LRVTEDAHSTALALQMPINCSPQFEQAGGAATVTSAGRLVLDGRMLNDRMTLTEGEAHNVRERPRLVILSLSCTA